MLEATEVVVAGPEAVVAIEVDFPVRQDRGLLAPELDHPQGHAPQLDRPRARRLSLQLGRRRNLQPVPRLGPQRNL
ncbi:hypothetical protein DL239_18730 [Sedimentitalea sp. CY04]|uniref:Uncharacterized protein n=1 Tax=Parasedimentitalea denitrificans TaxID=2211118 RepID=A0ABX0WDY3_9RHOB|nr:hypothetical protein [Sedimentitalea sp. CY04]